MESTEIQDFLQAEKAMMSDTIKELEKEVGFFKFKLTMIKISKIKIVFMSYNYFIT